MRLIKRIIISLSVAALCFSLVNVGNTWAKEEPQGEPQTPGVLEGTGTHFELKNSEYLNIILDSSEPISLILESVPEMITIQLESASSASSTQITISGFAPQTKYHKYEDNYHNHVAFTTDAKGGYTFTQDLSKPHLLFIQPRSSTIFLSDAGWSTPVGSWDSGTRIATLTQNLTETVQIDSDNITLDGSGHTVSGGSGIGVYLPERTGVTIKNLTVKNFSNGIYFYSCSKSNLTGNTTSLNSSYGIYVSSSSQNNFQSNTASDNRDGIRLYNSNNNKLTGNTASNNRNYGILLTSSGSNNLTGNTMAGNTYNFDVSGNALAHYVQTIDTTNTVDGKPIYYLVGVSNQVIDASTNAGYVGVVNCLNIKVKDLTLTKNSHGVLFAYTSNSSVENVNVSGNYYGIYLVSSSYNSFTGNTASNDKYGLYILRSSNNNFTSNTISNNTYGAYLLSANNNDLSGNTISGNQYEIYQDGKVNHPPQANAGGPYMGDEGSPIAFNASGSSDPDGDTVRYRWDFNNGNKWDTEWSSSPAASYTWDDDYSGVMRLAVTDGQLTSITTAQVTVKNVPPKVEAGSDKTAECGIDEVSFSGSFTDPGRLDTHVIKWDFGDGSTANGTLTPTHKYSALGKCTVTLTVTDDNGGVGSDTLVVNVVDTTPPKVVACDDVITEQKGYKGTDVTLSAKVSDICDPKPTVAWSHGPKATFPLGVTEVKVTATDKSGNSASDEVVVSVYGARTIKSKTIAKLESAKAGDKIIDRVIDGIIKLVRNSLAEELWVTNDSHLNPKHGSRLFHKVFREEEAAVILMQTHIVIFEKEAPILERTIAKKKEKGQDTSGEEAKLAAIKSALPVFREVVNDLAKADMILAMVSIGDANNTPVQNPKFQKMVDREIKMAEEELEKGNQELGKGRPAKAILNFEQAWFHTQLAIEFANKAG